MRAPGLMMIAALMAVPTMAQAKAGPKSPVCPPTTAYNPDLQYLDGYRIFTGPDGDSAVEPLRIAARDVPLLSTGKTLRLFDLPTAPKRGVQIVVGPANLDLPFHPAPYKEMFIMLSGSVTMETKKVKLQLKPGSVLLFEDVDAKVGHGGRTGPCGYISVSIAP